jgi:hypothetical protein
MLERLHIFQTMLEENEQQPTSKQLTHLGEDPRLSSFQAFVPINNFIPKDFRQFFSDSEYANLHPFSTDFNYRVPTDTDLITQQQRREAVLFQHQHHVYSLQKQARSPYKHPWSDAVREPHLARTEDELFDVVMSEFLECLGHQLDDAAQSFIEQYDHTAVEDNIAAFESEFLDHLIEVDIPVRKVTRQLPERRKSAEELLKIFRKLSRLTCFTYWEQIPWQLELSEYCVCVVGLRAVSSPKQQQRHTNRYWSKG